MAGCRLGSKGGAVAAGGCGRRDAAEKASTETTASGPIRTTVWRGLLRDVEQTLNELEGVLGQVEEQEQAQAGFLSGN